MEFCFYLDEKTGLAKTGAPGPIPTALSLQDTYVTGFVKLDPNRTRTDIDFIGEH